MADNKFERVDRDDHPDRCQATTKNIQCPYKRTPNSQYCPMHGGNKGEQVATDASVRMYRLARWQDRIGEFANHEKVKSLREEIGILRIVLEETLQLCKDPTDLLLYASRITSTVMMLDKVITSCHRLEVGTGALLDKSAAIHIASVIVSIISKYVTDEDAIDAISTEIVQAIVTAKTDILKEKANG